MGVHFVAEFQIVSISELKVWIYLFRKPPDYVPNEQCVISIENSSGDIGTSVKRIVDEDVTN